MMRIRSATLLSRVSAALLLTVCAACGELDPIAVYEPITEADELFMSLDLNHRAVNLSTVALHDEVQLVATPRSASGTPLTGLPEVTFRSSDTTRVWVSPSGLLRARRAGTNLTVIAEIITSDNIRRADTAFVNVITTAPRQIATFTIRPEPPAEPVWSILPITAIYAGSVVRLGGIDVANRLTPRILDPDGAAVAGLQVHYESLDRIVGINRRFGSPSPTNVGTARIVASTFAYGVALADTVTYTVTLPVVNGYALQLGADSTFTLYPSSGAVIRPGGFVAWGNLTTTPVEIIFDDPTVASEIPEVCAAAGEPHCGGGNIPPFGNPSLPSGIRARQFHVPGIYTFHTSTGLTGRVIVQAEDTP